MVRLANIDDAIQVSQIFEDAKEKFKNDLTFQWQGRYPNIDNFYQDLKNETIIVYEDNGVILGTATIVFSADENYHKIDGKWLNDERYLSIHRIATRKEHLKKGIATSLFKEAEVIALNNGIKNIKIDTHEGNKSMRSLLTTLGYTECGVIILLSRTDLSLKERERIAYQKRL